MLFDVANLAGQRYPALALKLPPFLAWPCVFTGPWSTFFGAPETAFPPFAKNLAFGTGWRGRNCRGWCGPPTAICTGAGATGGGPTACCAAHGIPGTPIGTAGGGPLDRATCSLAGGGGGRYKLATSPRLRCRHTQSQNYASARSKTKQDACDVPTRHAQPDACAVPLWSAHTHTPGLATIRLWNGRLQKLHGGGKCHHRQ